MIQMTEWIGKDIETIIGKESENIYVYIAEKNSVSKLVIFKILFFNLTNVLSSMFMYPTAPSQL